MTRKVIKKKARSKGFAELLDLLKAHPELVHALVFDPIEVKRLLRSRAARALVLGMPTRAFLGRVAGPEDGGSIALCSHRTAHLCPKSTRPPEANVTFDHSIHCLKGTRL